VTGRGRGRPAGRSAGDTRARLIAAAREQFAARGYARTSVRSIAAAAGVNASLVNHHFGGKQGLLVATMELPVDPLEKISGVLALGPDGLGERLVRTFLETWDPHREVFAAMLRTAVADPEHAPALDVARNVLIGLVRSVVGDHLKATLIAAQIIGLATMRYVACLEPLASAPVDDVVAVHGPAIQAVITGGAVSERPLSRGAGVSGDPASIPE